MHCSLGLGSGSRNLVYFILGSVIDVKVAMTKTSILAIYQDTYWYSDLFYDSYSTPIS